MFDKVFKKQFVNYEIALKLKELGFKEHCFAFYTASLQDDNFDTLKYVHEIFDVKYREFVENSWLTNNKSCTAPLYQQVTEWLREKHNIDIVIKPMTGDIKGQKNYVADVMIFGTTYYQKLARVDSYEEVLEAGLYEALSHLTV